MSEEEFWEVYPLWLLWQAVDKKPSEFLLAMKMPAALLENFFELDDLMDRLSKINAERIAAEEEEIRKRSGNAR
jgi:hypothetical protein